MRQCLLPNTRVTNTSFGTIQYSFLDSYFPVSAMFLMTLIVTYKCFRNWCAILLFCIPYVHIFNYISYIFIYNINYIYYMYWAYIILYILLYIRFLFYFTSYILYYIYILFHILFYILFFIFYLDAFDNKLNILFSVAFYAC